MLNNRKIIAALGATLFVIALSVTFLAFTTRESQADVSSVKTKPVAVEVIRAEAADLAETVSAVGTVAAERDVTVGSETSGRIVAVPVRVGDVVRKGQTLVQVDDELRGIAVYQAKAQLQAAETNLAKSRKDFERSETLARAGDIADAELEAYRLGFHAAESQHSGAVAALKLAQRQFEDTRIKSPIAGVVASVKAEAGEMVGPGAEVANIVDIANLKVVLSIPEEQIGSIRPRVPATLRIDTRPELVIRGTVSTVGTKVEKQGGHTYPVEVIVQKSDASALKVGMFARVEIHARTAAGAIAVPKEAIVNEQTQPAVFVVEEGVAHLRPVVIGIRAGDRYQVLEGVRSGDMVVSFGQKGLRDGSAVRFK